MDADDIVIGSGLAALATVLGLPAQRRVVVLAGAPAGTHSHYDARGTVPCAFSGAGGLGNDWHGVIPLGLRHNFGGQDAQTFLRLLAHFYPHADVSAQMGQPALFVPWKAIRPLPHLQALAAQRGGALQIVSQAAEHIGWGSGASPITVRAGGHEWRARRLWLAAGALGTPALLSRSLQLPLAREVAADHVFCYLGHVDGMPPPRIRYVRGGMVMPAQYTPGVEALYSLRPARFAFRQLDHGIEQRAVFGLPTGSAVAKIMRRLSPGLLTEAFYNRFGLLPRAARYSAYAQVLVPGAYALRPDRLAQPLEPQTAAIGQATQHARGHAPWAGLVASRRTELTIPGIHLHDTLDAEAAAAAGINAQGSPVQVVDASACRDIGPEHHSFKMMVAAWARAQASA